MNLEEALFHYFGFQTFREGQKEIIQNLLEGQDTLAVLPTGGGKSLCYQLTGYLLPGMTVIVSPLLSLMEDQVRSLQQLGEKRVIALTSSLLPVEKHFVLTHLANYQFIFLSPEMLLQEEVLEAFTKQHVGLFVIDEAHCISQWGLDFRPEYRNLAEVKHRLSFPVTLALTATANTDVQMEIKEFLLKGASRSYQRDVDRPNIALFVYQTDEKEEYLRQILEKTPGACIIYCATRKQVEMLYHQLKENYHIGYYHGGLNSQQRRILQQQFLMNELQILVATNAFGMGVDKPDIRTVIHYDLPDSLENYSQEIGRAGRDGQPSEAILLYQNGDERIHYFFQEKNRQERELFEWKLNERALSNWSEIQEKWYRQSQREGSQAFLMDLQRFEQQKSQKLQEILAYIRTTACRRECLLTHFDATLREVPKNCCDYHGAKRIQQKIVEKEKQTSHDTEWSLILQKMFKPTC